MMGDFRGRAVLKGQRLDDDCHKAKISAHEYGLGDDRKFCYGLHDASTEEAIDKCRICKAFVDNAKPLSFGEMVEQ